MKRKHVLTWPQRADDWFRHAICRVVYGHVMVRFYEEKGEAWYMCARCNLCQILSGALVMDRNEND